MAFTTDFTTIELMTARMGTVFITTNSDHDRDGVPDPGVISSVIDEASAEIFALAGQYYDAPSLASSSLIVSWATTLACYYLSINRGNPPPASLEKEYERILKRLEAIANGSQTLPGVPWKSDMRPTWSNRRIDRRYKNNTVRVTRTNSSNAPTVLRQDRATDLPLD